MKLNCPECKNDIDLTSFEPIEKDKMIECNMCGISLLVTGVNGEEVQCEIADEGK